MKVLVLGAGGMAGHVVALSLRKAGYEVDTLSAKNPLDKQTLLLDVTNKEKLSRYLSTQEYDAVVNCIGILVKQSDDRPDLAAYLNAYLPHFLEDFYKDTRTKVIHLSTDCVFSGKNAPYKEDSPYDGELFYDRSKALGEINNSKDLTFRMSIIGPDMQPSGVGLFNWFYKQEGEIPGYQKAIWSGITTIELAKGIKAALEQDLTGLYHLVPGRGISKFGLLGVFKNVFGRDDISIAPNDTVSLDKTLVNTRTDFDFTVGDYHTMVSEMRDWIITHKDLYGHYAKGNV